MHNDLAFAKGTDASQVLIDIEGNVVVKDIFDCASEFSEGFMSISTKNDRINCFLFTYFYNQMRSISEIFNFQFSTFNS